MPRAIRPNLLLDQLLLGEWTGLWGEKVTQNA